MRTGGVKKMIFEKEVKIMPKTNRNNKYGQIYVSSKDLKQLIGRKVLIQVYTVLTERRKKEKKKNGMERSRRK
jgi:hypothetical protein